MKQYFTARIVNRLKTKVVAEVPGTKKKGSRTGTSIYERFWTDLEATPPGKFLRIPAKAPRLQSAIGAFLYLRGANKNRKVLVVRKNTGMYVTFKTRKPGRPKGYKVNKTPQTVTA